MSLNFCKSCSILLVQNVCFTMRNPGLFSGGFHDKVVSILSFLLSLQGVKSFLQRSRRQDWLTVSASYMLLLCLHRWQCSTPGVKCISFPVDLTVVQKGFFFLLSNRAQRNANVQKSTFRTELHRQRCLLILKYGS